jgi:hypothetical protein
VVKTEIKETRDTVKQMYRQQVSIAEQQKMMYDEVKEMRVSQNEHTLMLGQMFGLLASRKPVGGASNSSARFDAYCQLVRPL